MSRRASPAERARSSHGSGRAMSLHRTPSIAAIVLGLDRLPKTRACIASLLRCEGWEPRIVLLANGSRDGTGDAIKREFPIVRVVRSDVNLGAAQGRNVAVAAATEAWEPELLFFVVDDAEVHPGAIAALARKFRERGGEKLAATAGKIRYPEGPPRIYVAGGSEISLWRGDTSPRGQDELDVGQYERRSPRSGSRLHDGASRLPGASVNHLAYSWHKGCALSDRLALEMGKRSVFYGPTIPSGADPGPLRIRRLPETYLMRLPGRRRETFTDFLRTRFGHTNRRWGTYS